MPQVSSPARPTRVPANPANTPRDQMLAARHGNGCGGCRFPAIERSAPRDVRRYSSGGGEFQLEPFRRSNDLTTWGHKDEILVSLDLVPARLAHDHDFGLWVRAFEACDGYLVAILLHPHAGFEELLANLGAGLPGKGCALDVDLPRPPVHILHDDSQAVSVAMVLIAETRRHAEGCRYRDCLHVIPCGNKLVQPHVAVAAVTIPERERIQLERIDCFDLGEFRSS